MTIQPLLIWPNVVSGSFLVTGAAVNLYAYGVRRVRFRLYAAVIETTLAILLFALAVKSHRLNLEIERINRMEQQIYRRASAPVNNLETREEYRWHSMTTL